MKSLLIALMATVLLFSACSKKPEKALPARDGKWEFTGTYTGSDTEPTNSYSISLPLTGSFSFDKSGTYTSVLSFFGQSETTAGTWTATESTVTLTNFLDESTVIFQATDLKRKSQTWDYSLVDGSESIKINLKLTR